MFYDLLIFIFMSYIKPQHLHQLGHRWQVVYRTIPTSNHNSSSNTLLSSHVVYRTIPTSNHNRPLRVLFERKLYIVLFLHQTTTMWYTSCLALCCISYYSYIKPQQRSGKGCKHYVVYRTIPTSNHNIRVSSHTILGLYIVLFLHQTTTFLRQGAWTWSLYIVLFLHQTTTYLRNKCETVLLYIVLFLHQTTTIAWLSYQTLCCISYYSYIKPQLHGGLAYVKPVVYRTIPTSNHNTPLSFTVRVGLYIVLFLHQTTTRFSGARISHRCISYYSYIKPQHVDAISAELFVVYRTIPTSNHNL